MTNESANAYSQAVQLSPKSSSAKTLLQAANCELQLHAATHDHSQKMATTRRKLDLFYEHITDLYYHQKSTSPDVLNYWNEHILDDSSNLWQSTLLKDFEEEKDDKNDFISIREIEGFDDNELRNILSEVAADISAEEKSKQAKLVVPDKKIKKEEKDLETALNHALAGLATEKEGNEKNKDSKTNVTSSRKSRKSVFSSLQPNTCRQRSYWYPDTVCLSGEPPQSPPVITLIGLPHNQPIDEELKRKLSSLHFDKQARRRNRDEGTGKSKEEAVKNEDVKNEENSKEDRTQYTKAYRQMEFLPYHSLPSSLEEVIFPNQGTTLADYDDPYWPTKLHCLQLVESSGNLPKFTGTFLTPEARGVR